MATYEVDGVRYNIDDGVDIHQVVASIRKAKSHQDSVWKLQIKKEKSYAGRVLTEGLPAVVNFGSDILKAIPAGIRGVGEAALTGSMERGLEGYESSMEQLKSALPRFGGVEDTEQALQEGLEQHLIRPIGELAGEFSEGTPFVMASDARMGVRPRPGAETAGEVLANFLPIPGAELIGRIPRIGSKAKNTAVMDAQAAKNRALAEKVQADAEKAQAEQAALEEARQKQFQEKAYQSDWIVDQQAREMGPLREPGPPPRGPQRDFWEAEPPVDTGLARPAVPEQGDMLGSIGQAMGRELQEKGVPFEREPGTGIYAAEKSGTPPRTEGPFMRDDGIPYAPVTDGVTQLLKQAREAEVNRVFERREAETRSGLPKEAEVARAYEERTGLEPGQTFLEKLEADLTRPRGPKGTGPFSGEVKLGIGIDAVEWTRKYGPELTERIKKMFDPKDGLGAVPWNQEVGYMGFERYLKPSEFLDLSSHLPRTDYTNKRVAGLVKEIESGKTLGPGFLEVSWDESNRRWNVRDHEGRHRAMALSQILGDVPVPVHFILKDGMRARHLKEGMVEASARGQDLVRSDERISSATPMGRQRGAILLPGKKQGPTYQDFLKELDYAKLSHLPESIKQEMWNRRKLEDSPEPITNVNQKTQSTVENIPGLDKGTRELYYDRRTDEQVAQDLENLFKEKGSKGDILHDVSLSPNAYRSQKHTLTRLVNSRINEFFDNASKAMDAMRVGTKTSKAGLRKVDPESPQGVWNALKKDERILVNDAAHPMMKDNFRGEITPETLHKYFGREPTPREVRAVQEMAKIGRYALERVENPWRLERGLEPIPSDTFYWGPALWPGEYIYFIRDKKGVLIEPVGTHLRPDSYLGRKFNKDLKRKLAEHGVDFDPRAWKRRAASDSMTLAGLEALYEHRHRRKDPGTQAIRTLVEEIQKDYAARKARSQHRQGYPGYLGSEGGAKGVKAQEKVWNRYVQQIVNAEASMEMAKLAKTIGTMKAADNFPKAKRAALAHLDRAMGAQSKGAAWFDAKLADAADAVGLWPSWAKKGVEVTNGIAIRWAIGFLNFAQAAIQTLQPGFALVKAVDLYTNNLKVGGKPVPPAIAQFAAPALIIKPALQTALDMIFRNNKYMRDLGLEGTFSPSMKHEYTGFGEVSFGERTGHKLAKFGIGDILQQFMETNTVRSPSGRFFHNVLEDLGVGGEANTRITKGLTDDYMVSFDQHKKAGFIGNTGTPGRFVGALQSFTTTYLGQLLEYSTKALKRGQVTALGSFLAYSYLVSGLLGMVWGPTADGAITLINKVLGTNYPTYTEWVLENNKSDSVRYGLPAAMTGAGINVKLAAPTFVQQQGPPSVSWVGATINLLGVLSKWAAWKTGLKDDTGKPSKEDWGKAWGDFSPASGRGIVEEEFKTKSGAILDRKGKLVLKRTPFDQFLRYLGVYSLRELETKRNSFLLKKEESELNEKRSAFIERLALRIMDEEGNMSQAFMEKAKALQFTAPELRNALARSIKEKVLDPELRAYGTLRSPRAVRAYQYYQRLTSPQERERATDRP